MGSTEEQIIEDVHSKVLIAIWTIRPTGRSRDWEGELTDLQLSG